MKSKNLVITTFFIILIGMIIWYERPRIEIIIEVNNPEATDFSKVVYVTKRLIHEAKVSLEVSASLNGEDSAEYNLAKINYIKARNQLDELYDLYPFSMNASLLITNTGSTPVTIKKIQADGNLDTHHLRLENTDPQSGFVKPNESTMSSIILEAIDNESSIAIYNKTRLQGEILLTITVKSRLNTQKLIETAKITFHAPN
jgi:hypothetical protein